MAYLKMRPFFIYDIFFRCELWRWLRNNWKTNRRKIWLFLNSGADPNVNSSKKFTFPFNKMCLLNYLDKLRFSAFFLCWYPSLLHPSLKTNCLRLAPANGVGNAYKLFNSKLLILLFIKFYYCGVDDFNIVTHYSGN